jgi:hypothetical protein
MSERHEKSWVVAASAEHVRAGVKAGIMQVCHARPGLYVGCSQVTGSSTIRHRKVSEGRIGCKPSPRSERSRTAHLIR